MSALTDFSKNFLRFNTLQTKNLVVVVQIPGVDLIANTSFYTRVRYGDPHINYGDPGIVYGGLRKVTGTRSLISLDSSNLTISQKNEPEQGRASIGQISIGFVDKDKYMTKVCSPGIIIPEIMGSPVTVFLGYQEISWPEDYLQIFRGVITDLSDAPGLVTLQFSDPNAVRRQQVFYVAQSILTQATDAVQTSIHVGNPADFPTPILGPDGTYDVPNPWNPNGTYNVLATKQTGVRTFFQIEQEWIEYGPLGVPSLPSATIQTIVYTGESALQAGVQISYTDGAIAGAEVVTVAGTSINVQIQSGVSTATQVITAVNGFPAAAALVTASLIAGGLGSTPQTAPVSPQSLTFVFSNVIRGARNTTAAAHAASTIDSPVNVTSAIQLQDNAMEMALKLMLSGWAGPWTTNQPIYSIRTTFDPILLDQAGAIILPDHVDAQATYGLTQGDYISITGATNGGNNNANMTIVRFAPLFDEPNRIIYVNQPLVAEYPTSAVMSFRSKWDTYPITCGVKLTPEDVDVQTHLDIEGGFINGTSNELRFFLTAPESSLKSFIESQIYLATGTYSLTKRGKLSVGYTKPPLADELLVFLDKDTILDPQNLVPQRGLNTRKFYNEIDWDYDYDDSGTATSFFRDLDVDSLSQIGISSILPLTTRGVRTDLGSLPEIQKRSRFLLTRYKRGAIVISCKANWGASCLIEAGDTVALKDEGNLQIANFATGDRNLGTQLFEVLERTLDIKSGNAQLKLLGGLGADATDRYATISPSSVIVSGTNSYLIFKDSYGEIYPGDEIRKWENYVGQGLQIHDLNYTYVATTTLTALDPSNDYKIFISGLSSPPPGGIYAGLIIDITDYPTTTVKTDSSLYKQIHAFFSKQVSVVSGISKVQFTVALVDLQYFFVGTRIYVHSEQDWAINSGEKKVTTIDTITGTITVDSPMGFVPDNTLFVSGLSFPDNQGCYRLI